MLINYPEKDYILKKIKDNRTEKQFSQEYMAMKLDISQTAYSCIESGKTDLHISHLSKIAETLERSIVEFFPAFAKMQQHNQVQKGYVNQAETINNHPTEVRSEAIDTLKSEVAFLREQLMEQMRAFQQERVQWAEVLAKMSGK